MPNITLKSAPALAPDLLRRKDERSSTLDQALPGSPGGPGGPGGPMMPLYSDPAQGRSKVSVLSVQGALPSDPPHNSICPCLTHLEARQEAPHRMFLASQGDQGGQEARC